MDKGTTGQASTHVAAPPEQVYEMVTDVRRIPDWSPECHRCEWLDGATGPTVGARFKGSNRSGLIRWSTKPRVVVADHGREFAFVTERGGDELTKWTYRFEPEDGGTRLTESFEMMRDQPPLYAFAQRWFMGIKDRRADLEANMATTLDRIKAAVE